MIKMSQVGPRRSADQALGATAAENKLFEAEAELRNYRLKCQLCGAVYKDDGGHPSVRYSARSQSSREPVCGKAV